MKIDIPNIASATLEKEVRKSFSMRVFPDQSVLIKVPVEATDIEIDRFIQKKRKWLVKQINFFSKFKEENLQKITAGMDILYLGKHYQLIVKSSSKKDTVQIEKNTILLSISDQNSSEKILNDWLQTQTQKIFSERFRSCLKHFPDISAPKLKIRKLNKRWGSYLKNHVVMLNPLLVRASKTAIDYVIIHELCHSFYRKHNEQFYNLLTAHLPNWKKIQENLEETVWGK